MVPFPGEKEVNLKMKGIWVYLQRLSPLYNVSQSSCCFKGRPLSVQQQMMQQSRQLDPNVLVKQQTPPSQQQSLHQPAMKSFLDNVMPHTTPELQKGPSPINAFSNFPIGGFLLDQCALVPGYHSMRPSPLPFQSLPSQKLGGSFSYALSECCRTLSKV